jgi:hypothetical protein
MASAFTRGMRACLPAFCLLVATACAARNPLGPTVPLNEQFTLARGESAQIDGAGFRLEFVQVTGDSRCPADVVCIQGGDALVHVRVLNGGTTAYELHTGDASLAAVTHQQLRIELVQLQPYPFSSRTIAPGEYRATFTVTRP